MFVFCVGALKIFYWILTISTQNYAIKISYTKTQTKKKLKQEQEHKRKAFVFVGFRCVQFDSIDTMYIRYVCCFGCGKHYFQFKVATATRTK